MIGIIFGSIIAFIGLMLAIGSASDGPKELLYMSMCLLFIAFVIIFTAVKKKIKKKKIKLEKATLGYVEKAALTHVLGLPIPEGALCTVTLYPDRVSIDRSGSVYNLELSKITDAVIKTETEIQNNYTSSIGGAIGGMMLFGGLGAVIGGRSKKKVDKVIHNFLIFSYQKEEEVDFISFDCTGNYGADKMVTYFASLPRARSVVTL